MFDPHAIPPHVSHLIDELAQYIQAATGPGVSDTEAERATSHEERLNMQLRALGWGAVLAESGRWMAVPDGYTIVHNPPDPNFYPHRCYQAPELPERWQTLWEDGHEVHFPSWDDAHAYVFAHQAREQALLSLRRFRVRPARTYGGDDYAAATAEQALHLHLNTWLSHGSITAQQVLNLDLCVFEHGGDCVVYCRACQHAPCTYTPRSQWPLPETAGWIASSL